MYHVMHTENDISTIFSNLIYNTDILIVLTTLDFCAQVTRTYAYLPMEIQKRTVTQKQSIYFSAKLVAVYITNIHKSLHVVEEHFRERQQLQIDITEY